MRHLADIGENCGGGKLGLRLFPACMEPGEPFEPGDGSLLVKDSSQLDSSIPSHV